MEIKYLSHTKNINTNIYIYIYLNEKAFNICCRTQHILKVGVLLKLQDTMFLQAKLIVVSKR